MIGASRDEGAAGRRSHGWLVSRKEGTKTNELSRWLGIAFRWRREGNRELTVGERRLLLPVGRLLRHLDLSSQFGNIMALNGLDPVREQDGGRVGIKLSTKRRVRPGFSDQFGPLGSKQIGCGHGNQCENRVNGVSEEVG